MKKPPLPKLEPLALDGHTLDLNYLFTKEYVDIGDASIELPTVIEWINYQLQGQIEQKHRLKSALERAEASAYFALKGGQFARQGYGDKPTEVSLDHAVKLDPDVTALAENLAIVTGWVDRLYNLQRSLQFRLEMVRSSEATRRTLAGTV